MPITWDVCDRRVNILFSDPYTASESEKVMNEIFARPGLARPLRFLVDVRQSTPPDIEFVGNAITFWQLHVRQMWGAKIAVVVSTERQGQMGQISERTAASRDLPFTIRVFNEDTGHDAERWLEEAP